MTLFLPVRKVEISELRSCKFEPVANTFFPSCTGYLTIFPTAEYFEFHQKNNISAYVCCFQILSHETQLQDPVNHENFLFQNPKGEHHQSPHKI